MSARHRTAAELVSLFAQPETLVALPKLGPQARLLILAALLLGLLLVVGLGAAVRALRGLDQAVRVAQAPPPPVPVAEVDDAALADDAVLAMVLDRQPARAAAIWRRRARLLAAREQVADAVAAWGACFAASPPAIADRLELGGLLVAAGRWDEARAMLSPIDTPTCTAEERQRLVALSARCWLATRHAIAPVAAAEAVGPASAPAIVE